MTGAPDDQARLVNVRVQADEFRKARGILVKKALAQVDAEMASLEAALEKTVLHALEVNTLTDVAAAYTPVGTTTPNRNAIYAIKKKHDAAEAVAIKSFPLEWVPRTVTTYKGDVTVFDLHAVLKDYGPLDITGEFTWTWEGDRIEPVINIDQDPYPVTTKFYKRVLDQYLLLNPYPGEE